MRLGQDPPARMGGSWRDNPVTVIGGSSMPRTTGTTSKNGNGTATRVKPYFERLEPVEAAFANIDGSPTVHVSVYDDRQNVGQRKPGIVVQVKSLFVNDDGETRYGKTATFTLDDPDRLGELAEFLAEVKEGLA